VPGFEMGNLRTEGKHASNSSILLFTILDQQSYLYIEKGEATMLTG
jgi:hypothetical protein